MRNSQNSNPGPLKLLFQACFQLLDFTRKNTHFWFLFKFMTTNSPWVLNSSRNPATHHYLFHFPKRWFHSSFCLNEQLLPISLLIVDFASCLFKKTEAIRKESHCLPQTILAACPLLWQCSLPLSCYKRETPIAHGVLCTTSPSLSPSGGGCGNNHSFPASQRLSSKAAHHPETCC